MPISRLSPATNIQSAEALSKYRSHISNIKAGLSDVRNQIAELNTARGNITQRIVSFSGQLKQLQSITTQRNDDVAVRWKQGGSGGNGGNQGYFKADDSSAIKRWVHGGRYAQERGAAASKLGLKARAPISLGSAMRHVNHQIADHESKLQKFDREWGTSLTSLSKTKSDLETKLSSAQSKLSSIKHVVDKHEAEVSREKLDWQRFSNIYQANVGFRPLNAEARKIFAHAGSGGVLKSSEIKDCYRDQFGAEVFYKQAGKELKLDIEFACGDITRLVNNAAKACYQPSGRQHTTFRGQGMTINGFRKLCESIAPDGRGRVYSAGQFLSTSISQKIAMDFPRPLTANPADEVKVIFTIKGNSGRGIDPNGAIRYRNEEREVLYSPLACFTVDSIYENETQTGYAVTLTEVESVRGASPLPY